jgi:hypothetical protein
MQEVLSMNNNEKLTLGLLVICSTLASALVILIHGLGTWTHLLGSLGYTATVAVMGTLALVVAGLMYLCAIKRVGWKQPVAGADTELTWTQVVTVFAVALGCASAAAMVVAAKSVSSEIIPASVLAESWKTVVYSIGFSASAIVGGRVFRMLFPLSALILLAFSLATWGALHLSLGSPFEVLTATLAILVVVRIFKKVRI